MCIYSIDILVHYLIRYTSSKDDGRPFREMPEPKSGARLVGIANHHPIAGAEFEPRGA